MAKLSAEEAALQRLTKRFFLKRGFKGRPWRNFFSDNLLLALQKEDFKKVYNRLKKFCKKITTYKEKLPEGYALGFEPYFHVGAWTLGGLHMILRDANSKMVGGIGFRIGLPMQIRQIQGAQYSDVPRQFYRKTGMHFDETLIDSFISLVHESFPEKATGKSPSPKVVFAPWAISSIENPALKNRIVIKYCTRSAAQVIGKPTAANTFRIRERFFAQRRRGKVPPVQRAHKKKPF